MNTFEKRLIELISIIPNWETYLTEKQLESSEQFIRYLNCSEVDYKLGLSNGTTKNRLFGDSINKGAIGRLELVYDKLISSGYLKKKHNNKYLSPKVKNSIKELIKLVIEIPNYESFLNNSQKERVYQFMRLRSISECAKYFNITETTFKQSLIGRDGNSGILGKLNSTAYNNISKWEDL